MTPAQIAALRASLGIREGHEFDPWEGEADADGLARRGGGGALLRRRAAAADGGAGRGAGGAACGRQPRQAGLDADGLRADPERDRPGRRAARRPDRHHGARRHRLDQPRRLGEPARAARPRGAGGHLQGRADPLDLRLGVLARRAASRARHRRGEPDDHALGARALARDQRGAAAAGRHGLRPLRAARGGPAQLCLLPGRALHPGRHAVGGHAGARGRGAPVDRAAPGRHGAGRARRLRAGVRRRAGGDHGLGLRLPAAGRRPDARPAHLAARRDRAGRSICGSRPGRWSSRGGR